MPGAPAPRAVLLRRLLLPVVVVAVNGTAGLMRVMRGNLLDVLGQPFVQTARAKGLKGRMGRTQPVDGMGFGGAFSSEIGRLRSMSLGPYEWDDPIVVVSNATEGAFASEEFAGNIGNRESGK